MRAIVAGSWMVAVLLTGCADGTSGEATRRTIPTTPRPTTPQPTIAPPISPQATDLPPSTRPSDSTPSDARSLTRVTVITGGLTPKSVVSDQEGHVFAQNMVYSHTVNVYDRSYKRISQISDTVDLTNLGHPGEHAGGPVEAAVSADHKHMYVTNYQMYGPGFSNPGNDKCSKGTWDQSYVYRIDISKFEIDQIIEVGAVPKYVATSPDGKWVLNSNWCDYDLSVIDATAGKEVQRVPLGRFPRGIAVTPDSQTAYVAVMGSSDIAKVDLETFEVGWIRGVGRGPRHLVIDAAGRYLYATLNSEGTVAKIDLTADRVVSKVASPIAPRSMVISPDGSALYVVNYESDAMSKIRTSDMTQVQRVPTNHHPIGVAYDAGTDQVWVACYSGSIMVFHDG